MAKFKVIKDFVFNGVEHKVGEVVELDYQQSTMTSLLGHIEKVMPATSEEDAEKANAENDAAAGAAEAEAEAQANKDQEAANQEVANQDAPPPGEVE